MGTPTLQVDSDERLVELTHAGSEAAFAAIVIRYRPMLVRECIPIVGHADAEEAAQDALLRAHRLIGSGYEVRRLGPWLQTIARNIAISNLRAARARPPVVERDCREDRSPDQACQQREQLLALQNAVAALPRRQREAIVMREFEGRSYQHISTRLGASEGAVRQLLNRARHELRGKLAAINLPVPLIRWIGEGGNGAIAARAAAMSGGCATTLKLATAIVLPVATTATVATAGRRTHHASRLPTATALVRNAGAVNLGSHRPAQFHALGPAAGAGNPVVTVTRSGNAATRLRRVGGANRPASQAPRSAPRSNSGPIVQGSGKGAPSFGQGTQSPVTTAPRRATATGSPTAGPYTEQYSPRMGPSMTSPTPASAPPSSPSPPQAPGPSAGQ